MRASRKVKIKKGDNVIIVTGKREDKGKIAKVLKVYPKTGKVLVEGVNYAKKAMRPDPQKNKQGGIQQEEMPIDISNIMIYCSKCNKGSRVKYKFSQDGKQRFRICHRCGEILDKTK